MDRCDEERPIFNPPIWPYKNTRNTFYRNVSIQSILWWVSFFPGAIVKRQRILNYSMKIIMFYCLLENATFVCYIALNILCYIKVPVWDFCCCNFHWIFTIEREIVPIEPFMFLDILLNNKAFNINN